MTTHPSLFNSSIRSLLVSFFTIIGISFGIFAFILLLSLLWSAETTPVPTYTVEYLPNLEGKRKILAKSAPVILRVNVNGVIGLDGLDTGSMQNLLVESREGTLADGRVKAILLFINSPGGTVTDADGIYRALKEYKKMFNVPVYAFVDGLCASGGMYIACSADKIYATEVSLIGSVGVISPSAFNFSKLLDKFGVESATFYAGKGKDSLNPFRPWKENEGEHFKEIIDYYYANFVDLVAASRPNLSKEELIKDFGAQVFPAEIAQKHGYVDDGNASYNAALKDLLKTIGIEDNFYQVVQLTKTRWVDTLLKSESPLITGKMNHQLLMADEESKLKDHFLYLYKP